MLGVSETLSTEFIRYDSDYESFVEKFKPKLTTDDCFTPKEVYEAVTDYVSERWGIDKADMLRPFFPGGDYRREEYPKGKVVVDNPPFSVLSDIKRFYRRRNIPFFLFCPTLTAFSGKMTGCFTHIIADADIVYENGAVVKTSFVTNLPCENVAETCPELNDKIARANLASKQTKSLPKYEFPDSIVTAAMMAKYVRRDILFAVPKGECAFVRKLDSMGKRGIFGGGLLLSEKAAAEKAAAKFWKLSDREKRLQKQLKPLERK